tara:strand:+ start:683 stop:1153 length:471 start_codon:yes stop_codon:yes gene_type:complete
MSKAIFWMMAGSTALQAYGKYQEGKQLKQLNEYNAAIQENNKVLADRKLANDLFEKKKRFRRFQGYALVAKSRTGLAIDFGSHVDLSEEAAFESEWETAKIKYNAEVMKAGYTAKAQRSLFVGKSAYYVGKLGAASTLLTEGIETYKYGQEIDLYA